VDLYLHLEMKRLAADSEHGDAAKRPSAGEGASRSDSQQPTDDMRQDLDRRLKAARAETG